MQNNQNHQLSKCQLHSFSLRALHKEKRHSLNASLTMCRAKQLKNKKSKANCLSYEGPILNRDKCHATPAFILPSQKIDYLQSTRQILRQHQKRVKETEQQIDDLYIPKPRSKNMYCNVCRQNYQQYLDHIQSASHKLNIRSAEFNSHILDLEKKFKRNATNDLVISSTESGNAEQDEESVEIIGVSGRKRIKTQNEQQMNNNFYPFFNQTFNCPTQPSNYNSFAYPQFQTICNPFTVPSSPNLLFDSTFANNTNYNPFTSLLSHQYMNYPLFYMPFQRSLTSIGFQQQG